MKIPVFYTPEMVADSHSNSPSAVKPRYVVEAWKQLDIPLEILPVTPLAAEELFITHDEAFVRGVINGKLENGFRNCSTRIAQSLLYTNASMRAAAVCALENSSVAVSPTAGFHHASYNKAEMYCTFNGLMVAAQYVLRKGLANRVGIIDCDFHYGNGTDQLIGKHGLGDKVKHFTAGMHYTRPEQAGDFFKNLKSVVSYMDDCDVILYQAGADAHIKDPLGGFLTTEELYERDRLVFSLCRQYRLPVAWNLAGGYQITANAETDWNALTEIHNNTMKACWEMIDSPDRLPMPTGLPRG